MMTAIKSDRLRQRFQIWDADKNGRVDRADHEAEALRIIRAFGETPDSPRGAAVLDAYLHMYDFLAISAGVGDDGMTEDQFVAVMESEMFGKGDSGFGKVLRPTIRASVDLCDTDGDGEINRAEYRRWLEAIGLDQSKADEAFRRMDTDGRGRLTVELLVKAVKDFYYGEPNLPLLGGR